MDAWVQLWLALEAVLEEASEEFLALPAGSLRLPPGDLQNYEKFSMAKS